MVVPKLALYASIFIGFGVNSFPSSFAAPPRKAFRPPRSRSVSAVLFVGMRSLGEVLFGSCGFTALGPWVQGSGLDFQANVPAVGDVAKFRA